MNKPSILYHASENNDLIQLDPRTDEERFAGQPLLFATPYKALAAMFLAPKVQPLEITKFDDEFILLVEGAHDKFIEKDLGGTIYSLPSEAFVTNRDLQMPDKEYVSKESVEAVGKDVYLTSMDAMKQNGVSVYFIDPQTMQAIRAAKDHGRAIIESLTSYRSE